MACRCHERRAAIVAAIKQPKTVLTAAKFVGKTSVHDVAIIAAKGFAKVTKRSKPG